MNLKEIAIVCIDENETGAFEWWEIYKADGKSDEEIIKMFRKDHEDYFENSEIRIDRVSMEDIK